MTLDTNTASVVLMISAVMLCVVGGIVLGLRHALRNTALTPAPEKKSLPIVEHIAPDVINAMPDGIAIIDSTGTYVDANPALCRMTGFAREELVGKAPPYPYWPEDQIEAIGESMLMAVRGEIKEYEVTFQRKDGSRFPVLITPASFIDSSSGAQYYLSTIQDISAGKETAVKLRESESRFRSLYDNTPVIFLSIDPDGMIHAINRFGADHLGYESVQQLVDQPYEKIVPEEARGASHRYIFECTETPGQTRRWESRLLRRDGTVLHVKQTMRAAADEDGVVRTQIICEDITETHHLVEQLAFEATHDPLTLLINRWEFERRLRQSLQNAADGAQYVLFYLDLDQFELINDSCGHAAGDQMLRQFGEMMQGRFGQRATIARLGGDEFGMLIEDCNLDKAGATAQEMRNLINDFRFECSGNRFRLTSSIGVVPIDADYATPEQVLQAADAACHSAKDMGRDRIYVYNADDKQQIQRRGDMKWVMRVRRALEDKRLRLVAQPIIPITGPNLGRHYEVLLRMVDEKGEMLPTANFMPAAERYGLSTQLDMWTVNTMYDWLSQRQVHLRNLHLCTINLSGHSLGNQDFHQFLMQKCIQGRVPLEKLCFEITETAAITNLAHATRLMRTLKRAGCSFALDDFGSGLSSFAYLKDLPVDYLKIDGVFVRGIAKDEMELAVLKSINDLGHMLGKKTVAEFVENQEVLGKLHQIGVDYAQGFGIGMPQPLEKIA